MHDIPTNGWIEVWTKCTECGGTGKIVDSNCTKCAGLGKKAVSVSISALTSHIEKQTMSNLMSYPEFFTGDETSPSLEYT